MLAWGAPAHAQEAPGDQQAVELQDHLLDASLSGVGDRHVSALTELSRRVPAGAPGGPDVWFWLARAVAERGDLDTARQTLLEGIRTGSCPRCRDLFQALEVERIAARRGATWTFDDPHHGVFLETGGAIRLSTLDGLDGGADRRVLEWVPEPGSEPGDRLVFGVRDGVSVLTIEARSAGAPTGLHVHVVDVAGRRFTTPAPLAVPPDRWVTLTVATAQLVPVGPGPAADPDDLRLVELVEWTPATGRPSPMWLDTVSVR